MSQTLVTAAVVERLVLVTQQMSGLVHSSVFIPGCLLLSFQYKFRDLTVEELKNVNASFPHFRYSMDTYGMKSIL